MAVTPEDVRHVAHLARLAIPEDQLAMYVSQLNGILSHMEALQRVPRSEVGAAAEAAREGMRTRDDQLGSVKLDLPREQGAPAMRAGFYLVPRLATHGDALEDE